MADFQGMGFLTMSTPPVLSKYTGTCGSYEPQCIGDTQHILFYTALALVAVGTAGHVTSLGSFLGEQLIDAIDNISTGSIISTFAGNIFTFVISVVAVLGLPYIKAWSLRFGIPAICILVATLVFLSGSRTYTYISPQGSHLTMVFRVLISSASKLFHRHPADRNELYGMSDSPLPHTRGLRCLDKAALVLPNQHLEQQNNRWRLCTVAEVEATKLVISLIPMSVSFIFLGLISSLGYTYFIEQAKNMNHKVGSLTIPLTIFFWFYAHGKTYFPKLYFKGSGLFCGLETRMVVGPVIGFMVSMILGVLCCVTAAKVESHRLYVVRSHGLLDKPDERIPLSVFWLLPQFVLLGGVEGMFETSAAAFFDNYFTNSLNKYMLLFSCVVDGFGCIGSILSVHIVGKVSERGGMPSWFQDTLNKSRLDNYYWFLACLCAVNLVLYMVMRAWYAWRTHVEVQYASEDPSCCCCC